MALSMENESGMAKMLRKAKEEPLVPVGAAATTAALLGAFRGIRRGDRKGANMYMRYRIYAQGFTVLALLVGSVYWGDSRRVQRQKADALKRKQDMDRIMAMSKEWEDD